MSKPSMIFDMRFIRLFSTSPVASSVLLIVMLMAGVFSYSLIKQETAPQFAVDSIEIAINYPGATPEEIEESILLPIENQLIGLEGVEEVASIALEDVGEISAQVRNGFSSEIVLARIKNAIDQVKGLPQAMETPEVTLASERDSIMEIALFGDVSQQLLHSAAYELRGKMLRELDVSSVDILSSHNPDIVIDVDIRKSRALGYSMGELQDVIIKKANTNAIALFDEKGSSASFRSLDIDLDPVALSQIPLGVKGGAGSLLLGDLANIGYRGEETSNIVEVNGKPAAILMIYKASDSKPMELASDIIEFITNSSADLAPEITLEVLENATDAYNQRIRLLADNGLAGFMLVLLILTYFLDRKVAFWVAMSIPITLISSFTFMPIIDIPINMVTLFAFILTLGILVDDAVVIAEKVYANYQQGESYQEAVSSALSELSLPLCVAVMTNILAFVPLLFIPGEIGQVYKPLALLVIAVFAVSLIEALCILPRHLKSMSRKPRKPSDLMCQLQTRYIKLLNYSILSPKITLSLFMGIGLIIFSWVFSGRLDTSFAPKYESTRVDVELVFHPMTTIEQQRKVLSVIKHAGETALEEISSGEGIKHHLTEIEGLSASSTFQLLSEDERSFAIKQFVDAWRENIPALPTVHSLFFDFMVGPGGGRELVLELQHEDNTSLQGAINLLTKQLSQFEGLADVTSTTLFGKPEFQFELTPLGIQLGFSEQEINAQIRQYYWGTELYRKVDHGQEKKVYIKANEPKRSSSLNLGELSLVSPGGALIKLKQIAELQFAMSPLEIQRVNGHRITEVTASVLRDKEASIVTFKKIEQDVIPMLKQAYPELEVSFEGEAEVEREVSGELIQGVLLAFILIAALLTLTYQSYAHMFITMTIIPLAIGAAILGHIVMGYSLSVLSLFGIIAVSGVVINGAMFLQLSYLSYKRNKVATKQAVIAAAQQRFQPIILSAVTTAGGLFPLLFETSTQALYLVPMAISLSFGIVFSIASVLFFVPALICVLDGVQAKQKQPLSNAEQVVNAQ